MRGGRVWLERQGLGGFRRSDLLFIGLKIKVRGKGQSERDQWMSPSASTSTITNHRSTNSSGTAKEHLQPVVLSSTRTQVFIWFVQSDPGFAACRRAENGALVKVINEHDIAVNIVYL